MGMTVQRIGTARTVWYGWDVRADTPGVDQLPGGPDRDDELAALYAWPDDPEDPSRPGRTVRVNMITSLDGGAALNGRSGGLGNEADQHLFAVLRDLADVILVGSGTVRAEQYAGVELDDERRARPGPDAAAVHRLRDPADRRDPPRGGEPRPGGRGTVDRRRRHRRPGRCRPRVGRSGFPADPLRGRPCA